MKNEINFGIGFITGRPNVCNIINAYYQDMIDQVKCLDKKVNFTIFILYDLKYLNTNREEFYNIKSEVFENINIKYLTPEYIQEKKKKIAEKHSLTEEEVDLLIGTGYGKARNSILYEAVEEKIDYLMFWDDDEYPLAAVQDGKNIKWLKQNNILEHIKNIENADLTYGYRCGMIRPLPVVEYNDTITEEVFHRFIDGLENDAVSWSKIQETQKDDLGIGYADIDIATQKSGQYELEEIMLLGSGICLNLNHLEKIPAFYNPPEARGEDTLFSCVLQQLDAKVIRTPVYHFHDAFLKFTFLMEGIFPKKIKKITTEDNSISLRFKRTTIGWTKYKPLLYYITQRNKYREIINQAKKNLELSVKEMSTAFPNCDLTVLTSVLEEYDKNVELHYKEFLKVIDIWDRIKYEVNEERWSKIEEVSN